MGSQKSGLETVWHRFIMDLKGLASFDRLQFDRLQFDRLQFDRLQFDRRNLIAAIWSPYNLIALLFDRLQFDRQGV